MKNLIHHSDLADLQGPKLRVGIMNEGIVVNDGDHYFTTAEDITA
jgi:pyruvate kinase